MNENVYENRFERREARRALRSGGEWIGGVMLVLLGLILLGQNMKILAFENWWALFILLPALGSFATAWRLVQAAEGRLTRRARSAAIVGLALTFVTAMFLLELNWFLVGPGLLIVVGLGLFINALLPE